MLQHVALSPRVEALKDAGARVKRCRRPVSGRARGAVGPSFEARGPAGSSGPPVDASGRVLRPVLAHPLYGRPRLGVSRSPGSGASTRASTRQDAARLSAVAEFENGWPLVETSVEAVRGGLIAAARDARRLIAVRTAGAAMGEGRVAEPCAARDALDVGGAVGAFASTMPRLSGSPGGADEASAVLRHERAARAEPSQIAVRDAPEPLDWNGMVSPSIPSRARDCGPCRCAAVVRAVRRLAGQDAHR